MVTKTSSWYRLFVEIQNTGLGEKVKMENTNGVTAKILLTLIGAEIAASMSVYLSVILLMGDG